jgi:hypothetical protein
MAYGARALARPQIDDKVAQLRRLERQSAPRIAQAQRGFRPLAFADVARNF